MAMQDKEFDELFHSKLENFELKPSANVWNGIDDQLDTSKRRRILLTLLSVAASIIVLVAAGVLFIPKTGNVTDKNYVQNRVANTAPHTKSTQQQVAVTADPLKTTTKPAANVIAKNINQAAVLPANKSTRVIPVKNTPAIDTAGKFKHDAQPILANVPQQRVEITKPEVPDKDTKLSVTEPAIEEAVVATKPVLAAVVMPDKQNETTIKKKHHIRSFGDLINVVVAKVDKRKDKVIEFTDTDDDDETNLTGVNLGILRIKKDK